MLDACKRLTKVYIKKEKKNSKRKAEAKAGNKGAKKPKNMDPKEWRRLKAIQKKAAEKRANVLLGFSTGLLLKILSAPAVVANSPPNFVRDVRAYVKDSYWYTETVGGSPQTSNLKTIFKKIIEKIKLEEQSGFDGEDNDSEDNNGGSSVVLVEGET